MVSLDVARYQMESEGKKIWNEIIDLSNYLRDEVNKIDVVFIVLEKKF